MRILRRDDFDAESTPPPEQQDVRLRELVDSLPLKHRHMVSRVYFGQATLTEASAELGLSRSTGRRLLDDALAQLRTWLETDAEPDPVDFFPEPPPSPRPRCTFVLEGVGQCQQEEKADGLCSYHTFQYETGIVPDAAQHERIVRGGRNLFDDHTEVELEALVNGRYRGDGRRIDQFVYGMEPLGFYPPRKDRP